MDYNIDDVLHRSQLPIKVRFVSPSTRANDSFNAHSLTKLGNIQLTEKSEVDMVFAASIMEKELLVYLFPKTLKVRVGCGFKVSSEMTKKIKTCRESLEKSDRNLKILDNLIKSSFYFTARPVRSFNLRAMKIAPVPHPRSLVTKQGKPSEDLSSNREVLISHELVAASTSNNSCSAVPNQKLVSGKNLERSDCKWSERDELSEFFPGGTSSSSAASKLMDVFIREDSIAVIEVPPLPPKLGTLSRIQERNEDFQSHRSKEPSPLPRKTVGEKVTCGGKTTEECTTPLRAQGERLFDYNDKSESYTVEPATSTDDHVPDTFPELPPKPTSLKTAHIESKTDANRGDAVRKPPPLPPKTVLSQRQKAADENDLDLPYLVVDVTDWRKIEAVYRGYAVVTDDGCILEEDEASDYYIDLISESDETGHYEDANGQKPEEGGKIDDPDVYETLCDDIERLGGKENQRDEQHGSNGNHKSYHETVSNFHVSNRQRNSRSGNVEEQQKLEATKLSNTDSLNKSTKSESCAGRREESQERPRLRESRIAQQADQQIEEESTHDDRSYEEVENLREILQRPRLRESRIAQQAADQQIEEESTDDDQSYEEVENLRKILQRPRLRESRIAQQADQEIEEESTDDDQAYEEVESPREIFQSREFSMGEETERQITLGLKSSGINQSGNTNSSRNRINTSRSTSSTEYSRQTRRVKSRHTSRPRNTGDIWISARREDDCMDYKDIEQFFKLRKQLGAARAQVEDLKRQVTVKEEDSVEPTWTLLKSDGSSRKLEYQTKQFNAKISNSQHGNSGTLDSTMTSSKQPKKKSNSRMCYEGGFGKKMGEKAPNSPSLAKEGQTTSTTVRKTTLSSDNDEYVDCYERIYVNQEILVKSESAYFVNTSKGVPSNDDTSQDRMEAIYCNTVKTEASSHLQFAYQSDEDEIAYVNVDTKDRDLEVAKTKLPGILEDETSVVGSSANPGESSC